MFKLLLGKLNPYMMYAKIALIAVALLGASWAGHFVTKTHYIQKEVKMERAANSRYRESVQEYKKSVASKESIIREVRKTNIALLKKIRVDETQREEDIQDAIENSVTDGYSVGFGRVWNDSLCRANGMPGCVRNPGELAGNSRGSDLTSETLLRNHGRVAGLLAACYRNIEKIKSLQDKHRKSLEEK